MILLLPSPRTTYPETTMLFGQHHDVSPHDACLSALQNYHDAMTHFGTQLGGYVDGSHGVTAGDVAHAGVVAYAAGHTADTACDPGQAVD